MDVSNKTLAMFLVAAIVVSIGGTIISLNVIQERQQGITGFATSDTGNVSLSIGTVLSITTSDSSLINFGACSPAGGTNPIIDSETVDGDGATDTCPNYNAISNLTVRNDGNVYANVSINSSKHGDEGSGATHFLDTPGNMAKLSYKITNHSTYGAYKGGCISGAYQSSWLNITSTNYDSNMLACDNLSFDLTDNSFAFDVQIKVPSSYSGGQDDVIITFEARNV